LFSDTSVSGGSLNATCYINSDFYVVEATTIDDNTVWLDSADTTLFSKIIDTSTGPSTDTAVTSELILVADITTFEDTKTTTDDRRVITIKTSYYLPQQSPVSSTF